MTHPLLRILIALMALIVGIPFAVHGYRGIRTRSIQVGNSGLVHGPGATRWGWVYLIIGVTFAAFGVGFAFLID